MIQPITLDGAPDIPSLRAMRDVGLTSANLGVDTENPTGALRLYEDLGFAPDKRFASYRKPLTGDDR